MVFVLSWPQLEAVWDTAVEIFNKFENKLFENKFILYLPIQQWTKQQLKEFAFFDIII
jgi:hypothetical protein